MLLMGQMKIENRPLMTLKRSFLLNGDSKALTELRSNSEKLKTVNIVISFEEYALKRTEEKML